MGEKKFASQGDLAAKTISFDRLSEHAYAFTAEGDPNTRHRHRSTTRCMVIDTQATPVMAQDVIRRIRDVTDKPINYVVLSHYHAVRVLGASGYGAQHIIASRDTLDLIVERGEADMTSEIERFPRLFRAVEIGSGPDLADADVRRPMTLWLGQARGARSCSSAAATPRATRWSGCRRSACCSPATWSNTARRPIRGDAYYEDWPATLDALAALEPQKLVPGRGAALQTPRGGARRASMARAAFVAELFALVKAGAAAGKDLRGVLRRGDGGAAAEIRRLGHLRSLPAVRRSARLRRGHRLSRSAHLDGAARQARCGTRSRADGATAAGRFVAPSTRRTMTYTAPVYPYDKTRRLRLAAALAGDRGRGGPGGARRGDRPRPARHRRRCCSTKTTR